MIAMQNDKELGKKNTQDARPPHETTEIPPFLRGADPVPQEVAPVLEEPEEIRVPEEIPHRKAHSHVHKEKPDPLNGVVQILSYVVCAVFVIYVAVNIFWAFSGTPAKKVTSATPTPSAAATSEPTQQPQSSVLGTAVIQADAITMRDAPSISGAELGAVYSGETYSVYSIQTADGYTWYQIEENGGWVASDGTWVSFTENGD